MFYIFSYTRNERRLTNVEHIYIAIDLKSFYASVECVERGLDPLITNLVVADNSRTEKTEDILDDIRKGFSPAAGSKTLFIADRREAIRTALMLAPQGATILLAGKGHETYQIIGTEHRHFDEREIVAEVFAAMENQKTDLNHDIPFV